MPKADYSVILFPAAPFEVRQLDTFRSATFDAKDRKTNEQAVLMISYTWFEHPDLVTLRPFVFVNGEGVGELDAHKLGVLDSRFVSHEVTRTIIFSQQKLQQRDNEVRITLPGIGTGFAAYSNERFNLHEAVIFFKR